MAPASTRPLPQGERRRGYRTQKSIRPGSINEKAIADEHFGALYPPTDRDLADDAGGARFRHRGLWSSAGRGIAEGRFSDDRSLGQLSRRQPRHDGVGDRDTPRA